MMTMTDPAPDTWSLVTPETLELFRRAGRVLILTHHNPDGDALGSSSGLARTLIHQGRRAELFLAGVWSDHLNFLLEGLTVRESLGPMDDYDLVVLLDCHGFDRLGPAAPEVESRMAQAREYVPLVVIDHHLLSEDETATPTWLHDETASSTGELVWNLLWALDWIPTPPAIQALLLAICTDTGFFSQTNTTPGALRASADLVELGGDLEDVNRRVKRDLPLRRLKLMGRVLDEMKLHFDGRLAESRITPVMLAESGATMSDSEDFVEMGRGLAGVSLSALIKDSGGGPGTVRVSLRSRDEVDAQALAKTFGGGGHRQASAYNDSEAANADEALKNLLTRAEKFL